MSVQLTRYHEDLADDGRDLRVQVDVDGVEVAVTATANDDVAMVDGVNHLSGTTLPRESFPAVVEAVAELRDRGFEVDVGPLGRLVERQQESDASEAPTDSDADADDDEDDTDDVWCGICGKGPFQSINIHHGQMHPDEDKVVLDHEPEPAELGVIVGYGDDDQEDDDEDDVQEEPELPPWLNENPTDVMADAGINRTLDEVLREVESQDSILAIQQRLAAGTTQKTKELLSRLGLTAPGDNELIAEAQQATRVPIVRAVARDDDE